MKRSLVAAMLAASALAIIGGCASVAPQDYNQSEAATIQTVTYGTIESVRRVWLNEDHAPVGTIAGAAIGGLLGNGIGHGNGRAATTVIGALGGGLAGNAIERHVSEQDGEEIVVRLDNGTTVAVVQGASQGFEAGQRVRVLSGPKGSRVEHA